MQIAKRVYSLAQEQHDSALMIGTYRALAVTLYYLGDFKSARQYAMSGIQVWRSGGVQSPVEEITAPSVSCLIFDSPCHWHFGDAAHCHATMSEAISVAEELHDLHALAVALCPRVPRIGCAVRLLHARIRSVYDRRHSD